MATDDPPQNIYDDPAFFAAYSRLERFGAGWTRAFEHASFMALLPDVVGKRALDLGCGAGRLAHHLAERGAAEVVDQALQIVGGVAGLLGSRVRP